MSASAMAFGAPGIDPRWTSSAKEGLGYRIIKHVLAAPHCSVLLVHTALEVHDATLRGKLHLYALLAPHLGGA